MRWDADPLGHGIADASAMAPGIRELLDFAAVEITGMLEGDSHFDPHGHMVRFEFVPA